MNNLAGELVKYEICRDVFINRKLTNRYPIVTSFSP